MFTRAYKLASPARTRVRKSLTTHDPYLAAFSLSARDPLTTRKRPPRLMLPSTRARLIKFYRQRRHQFRAVRSAIYVSTEGSGAISRRPCDTSLTARSARRLDLADASHGSRRLFRILEPSRACLR